MHRPPHGSSPNKHPHVDPGIIQLFNDGHAPSVVSVASTMDEVFNERRFIERNMIGRWWSAQLRRLLVKAVNSHGETDEQKRNGSTNQIKDVPNPLSSKRLG